MWFVRCTSTYTNRRTFECISLIECQSKWNEYKWIHLVNISTKNKMRFWSMVNYYWSTIAQDTNSCYVMRICFCTLYFFRSMRTHCFPSNLFCFKVPFKLHLLLLSPHRRRHEKNQWRKENLSNAIFKIKLAVVNVFKNFETIIFWGSH